MKANHLIINDKEVIVKYAKEYSGKFLPSYKGQIIRNDIKTESDMHGIYGDYACWSHLRSETFFEVWRRDETILKTVKTENPPIQVLPGMIMYNFSTPTKEMFCEATGLESGDIEVLNGDAGSNYENGHLAWRGNFQYYYKGTTENTLKPYQGMLIQLAEGNLSDNWETLDDGSKSNVKQYKYNGSTTSTDKRPSYIGMIVADTVSDTKEKIATYYYGTWEQLDDGAKSGVYQYIRIK